MNAPPPPLASLRLLFSGWVNRQQQAVLDYLGSKKRVPGRPRTKANIAALVVRIASENPTWGNTRIRGGLKSLAHKIARNAIKTILKERGIDPAPERGAKTPWKTFLVAIGTAWQLPTFSPSRC